MPPFANAIASGGLSYEGNLEPTVFICGDDAAAKAIVGALVRELGAQPVDAGPLTAARLVEPAMMLAVSIAYAGVPRDVGLRLLERTASLTGPSRRARCPDELRRDRPTGPACRRARVGLRPLRIGA